MGLVSLVVLVTVILAAYKCKVNTGLLGVAAAFLLGFALTVQTSGGEWVPISSAAGKSALLIKGWSSGMFLTLLGVTFLFGIARANNTLLILTQRLVALVGGRKWLLPIAIFGISFLISVIGPGPINGMAIIAPLAGQIAYQERINPLLMMLSVYTGNLAGGLTPISPSGYVALTYAAQGGVDIGYNLLLNMAVAFTILFVISYVVFQGWKDNGSLHADGVNEMLPLERANYITLAVIIAVILAVVGANLHVGLTAMCGAVVLLILQVSTEKEALANVPWGTILMVCGMGVMVSMVNHAGGITYLTDALIPYINDSTAAPIMIASGALMSSVASAMGVVMPTLIPVSIGIAHNLGLDPKMMVYSVVLGAHISAISPFSSLGALSLSSVHESVDKQQFFVKLIMTAIAFVIIGTILTFLGLLLQY